MPRHLNELPAVVDLQELLHVTSPEAHCLGGRVEQVKLSERCIGEATLAHVHLTYRCNQPTQVPCPGSSGSTGAMSHV